MTWRELKAFCNQLPESELVKNVIMWREEEAITCIDAFQLEEDYYIEAGDPYGEGCFAESEMSKEDPDLEYEKVYDKGHPLLSEDF